MSTVDQDDKSANSGSGTLINFSLFLVIVGVVLWILPSFLYTSTSQPDEAKQYVGTLNRAQQAYYMENRRFAGSIDALDVGIRTETTDYQYSMKSTKDAVFNYGFPKSEDFRGYVGGVFLIPSQETNSNKNEMTTISILCVTPRRSMMRLIHPRLIKGSPVCSGNTEEVRK